MDSTLTRYLLGNLPQQEIDALDERSIVDAEFAEQLRAAEHDLADAYARGELSAEDRLKWERGPGASAEGQAQVRLARAMHVREQAHPGVLATGQFPRYWAVAAAAVIAVAVGSAYVLRSERDASRAPASAQVTPATDAPAAPAPAAPSLVAITLPIPTRDASEPPILVIPAATQQARITLRLEPSEFAKFSLALVDPGTKRVVWRANDVAADTGPDGRTLTAQVPVDVLRSGRAIFQVMGATDSGSELVGMYPFIIDRKT